MIFAPQYFSLENSILVFLGFIVFCLISSANYVRNDIIDIESDKHHPKKKERALPSGKISIKQAYIIFFIFIISGISIAFSLNLIFGSIVILFLLITECYSRWIKKLIILDVFAIGANFLIRAISGVILLQSSLSPWIIMGVFFVALFLGFTKRKSELETLGKFGVNHRIALQEYTLSSLNSMVLISAMLVIITYSFYSLSEPLGDWRLVLTVPIIVFIIMRQLHLSAINHPLMLSNNILKDKMSVCSMLVYIVFTIFLIYFLPNSYFNNIT